MNLDGTGEIASYNEQKYSFDGTFRSINPLHLIILTLINRDRRNFNKQTPLQYC